MDTKKLKQSTKKLNNFVITEFPSANLDNAIIFEKFHFNLMLDDTIVDSNHNWIIGNDKNIFLISLCNTFPYIQKLEHPLAFSIPEGLIHPDFSHLVELNFKNFNSYLLFNSLNKKLTKKNTHSLSKI